MRRVVGRLLHSSMQRAFRQWAAWAHVAGVRAELNTARETMLEAQREQHVMAQAAAEQKMAEMQAVQQNELRQVQAEEEVRAVPLPPEREIAKET